MNRLFPIFLNLKNKNVLIVGLGKIAYRKATILYSCGANIISVGKELREKKLNNISKVFIREYEESDIENIFIAVAATDDKEINKKLCESWDAKNIITNNATSREPQNAFFVHNKIIDDCHVAVSGLGNPSVGKKFLDKLGDSSTI